MAITYEKNIAGFGGVRKFSVVKPSLKAKKGVGHGLSSILERN